MGARSIAGDVRASSCYFRTTAEGGSRKALVQIDERCNLRCAHCFVSATKQGQTMGYDDIVEKVIPRLGACRVDRVTLTGGEPTIHPEFLDVVRAFRSAGMGVGVCTNATTLGEEQIAELIKIGGVHCNVSLDGFRPESHGKFRGGRDSFHTTIATVEALAKAGLLQGLLCTPNSLAEDLEYRQLCQFAVEHGAEYVLMNPLSAMGRGVKARRGLAATEERMLRIHQMTDPFDGPDLDVVRIRFRTQKGNPSPAARPARSFTCSPPARWLSAPTWFSPPRLRSHTTTRPSSSSATSSPIPASPSSSTPTKSPSAWRWALTRRAGPAASRTPAGKAAQRR